MKKNYTPFIIAILLLACKLNAQVYFNPTNKAFSTGNGPIFIISADFNADGKKDLATANNTANNVSVLLGTGTGVFGVAANFAVGTSPYAVTSADFNGDTKVDLAVCNSGTNNVSILLGNGAGSFGAAANFACGTGPRGITSGDFNGDAIIDIATANYNGNNVSILLGTGTGTFGAAANFTAGTGPRCLITSDLNGDSKLDLAVTNETSNNISILTGNGSGGFSAATNFASGTNPRSITCADFNGDGKKDLATANFGSNNISLLAGTGTGNFGAATNITVGTQPVSITSADFNMDAKVDLAVAEYSNPNLSNFNNIRVFIGTGTGTFNPAIKFSSTIWTVPANPSSLVSGDFNNDTKPDIALVNYTYNSASSLISYIPAAGNCPNPMRIVILGASSSFGFGASEFDSAYAYRFRKFILDSVNGFSEIINISHAGYTTYAMQPDGYPAPGAYPVDTLRNITKAISLNPDAVIFNFTTNDINNLISLDTTIANFKRSTGMLTTLSIPFWITTTQPRNFTGDPVAVIAQKKQMIRDLRDTIIKLFPLNNVESFLGFQDINDDILPQYDCGDHAHFTDAGHKKLFDNFKSMNIPGILCPMLTGVTKTYETETFSIYPNPTTGIFTIQSEKEITSIEICNALGDKIYRSEMKNNKSEINLSGKPKGIYFIRIVEKDKPACTKKIIITE